MSIIYAEGFDDGILRGQALGVAPTVSALFPRTGAKSLRCFASSGSFTSSLYRVNVGSLATGWTYVAFIFDALYGATVVSLNDNGTRHLNINLRTDGKFEVQRNGVALTGGVGTFVYTANTYVQLAMKYTINDTTGAFELRINGSPTADIGISSVDTRNGANALISQYDYGWVDGLGGTRTIYIDDIIVQDALGASPENTWLGDIEAYYLFPNGAGSSSQGTIGGTSPAATRWQSLNEVVADNAVTTVDFTTVTDKLLMAYDDIPVTTGVIYAVIPILRALKTSAGARAMRALAYLSATQLNGSDQYLSTSWVSWQPDVWHRDPLGNVWTGANVNAAEFGVQLQV